MCAACNSYGSLKGGEGGGEPREGENKSLAGSGRLALPEIGTSAPPAPSYLPRPSPLSSPLPAPLAGAGVDFEGPSPPPRVPSPPPRHPDSSTFPFA